jgi:predicted HAD superfamily hydrolase
VVIKQEFKMKVLVWNAPWSVDGNLLFFKNCFLKHLLLQANLLSGKGIDVDLITTDYIIENQHEISSKINIINLTAQELATLNRSNTKPMLSLYGRTDEPFIDQIKSLLKPKLKPAYDVILLWENPVPFLEDLYPGAVIIHQMPGAFGRAPYPSMVTFDPNGLYRHGAPFVHKDRIIHSTEKTSSLVSDFATQTKNAFQLFPQVFQNDVFNGFEEYALLPLQVSSHYAFQADTPYTSQMDYLLDVLSRTPAGTGVVATQYVTPNISDTVLNADALQSLKASWPNLIFSTEFDDVRSVSQFLLPKVSGVITCSSSIGLQSMLWSKKLDVYGDTFLSPYSDDNLKAVGADPDKARKNLLDYILSRNQVLATKVVHDADFLVNLLESLVSQKKSGAAELSVPFDSIDAKYSDELISSVAFKSAGRAVRRASPMLDAELKVIADFEQVIKANKIETFSFDVFDTLIDRPVEVPADAYQFLETEALKISKGATEDFARVRLNAEVQTREASTEGEITLDQIYAAVRQHYQLSQETSDAIQAKEIDMEIRLVERRQLGYRLWNLAKATGKKVTVISDMYLPEFVILEMLKKTGYTDYEKLYVSSTYGVRKKEGPLFDVVIQEQGITPARHLHTGDNRVADIEKAEERGMHGFRIPRAIDRMRGNAEYNAIFNARQGLGQKSRSVIAGLIADHLFDLPSGKLERTSLFMGMHSRLGFAALGPLLSAYMLWLTRRAKSDGVTRLYFLSREGWLLKEVYEALNRDNPSAVPCTYLYCSRRAARVAALTEVSDITAVAAQPYQMGVKLSRLLNQRFGLDISPEVVAIIKASGFKDADTILAADTQARVEFSRLCVQLAKPILAQASVEREHYLRYLKESGFADEPNAAVVDIGWKANMQGSLGALIGKPLRGYYYATLQGVDRWEPIGHSVQGFAGDSLSIGHPSAVVSNRHLCEYLTCKADGSLISFGINQHGALAPLLRFDEGSGTRNLVINEIHRGTIEFAATLQARFGPHTAHLVIDPMLAERVFKQFVETPTEADASLLTGQFFEDAFGGIDRKYVIGPDARSLSVWQAGAAVVYPPDAPAVPDKKEKKEPVVAAPVVRQPAIGVPRKSKLSGLTGAVVFPIEKLIIRNMVNEKKFAKYKKDRSAFFEDSKDTLAIKWYAFTNPGE